MQAVSREGNVCNVLLEEERKMRKEKKRKKNVVERKLSKVGKRKMKEGESEGK